MGEIVPIGFAASAAGFAPFTAGIVEAEDIVDKVRKAEVDGFLVAVGLALKVAVVQGNGLILLAAIGYQDTVTQQ